MIDKEKFIELACEIAEWHEQTFPDATEDGQILKLSEEFTEWREAGQDFDNREEKYAELADILIVAGVLEFRYDNAMGKFIFDDIIEGLYLNDSIVVLNAVQTKMEINRRRKWIKLPDGRYKHIEGEK
jgi:hypothetical protein